MPLVKFNTDYRRMWMFPRPIRTIPPWKISKILQLLSEQSREKDWSGNQTLQNNFILNLNKANLKNGSELLDQHSGGARTYLALLRALGLIFIRDKKIYYTISGEAIMNVDQPLNVLQTNLLRFQFPSPYSMSRNVHIHPDIRVKPFLFILELLLDKDIKYLTQDEMIIPVIYGHNNSCKRICKDKILSFRSTKIIDSVIDNFKEDFYTPKIKTKDFLQSKLFAKDVANTMKNYLQSACLIIPDLASKEESKFFFNYEYLEILDADYIKRDEMISEYQNEELFQRSYGSWTKIKDNRRIDIPEKNISKGEGIIIAYFFEFAGQNIFTVIPSEFIDKMKTLFGFNEEFIIKTISPYLKKSLSLFESTYLDYSQGGVRTATKFEKSTGAIFSDKFLFNVAQTGQKHRTEGVGGYADLFIIDIDEENCAIIDTKASSSYSLPSNDYYKMQNNYIPHYHELAGDRKLKLEFATFVAGNFFGSFESKLKTLTSTSGTPVSGITAKSLIEIANNNISTNDQKKIRELFKKSKIVKSIDYYS